MTVPAATFLPGAKSRLLPASVPFRYFAGAVVFHVAMWGTLLWGAAMLPDFAGGLGLPLAALHLLTLGVLVMTTMGAVFQLLPVATRRPMPALWATRLGFWLLLPGILALAHGMATGTIWAMIAGGGLAVAALLLLAAMMAINLAGTTGLPLVAAHLWVAVASLVLFVGLAAALVTDFQYGFLPDRIGAVRAHMVLAGYGFMGMLVLGLSQLLVPMFALSPTPAKTLGWGCFAASLTALALGAIGAFLDRPPIMTVGALAGLVAAGLHLAQLAAVMKRRMRKRMGVSFVLVRVGWIMLPASLALAAADLNDLAGPHGATLFGLALFGGWLLTFLLGILQRIMPFLAAMHVGSLKGKPPLVSELTTELPLKIHAFCHFAALALLAGGILFGSGLVVTVGAAVGLVGAISFAVFAFAIVLRLATARRAVSAKPKEGAAGG
jgi:hypothetical protein